MASIAIISSSKYHKANNKVLLKEAEKTFEKVLFVPVNKVILSEENGASKLMYKNTNLLDFDACYPRFGSSDYFMGEAVLRVIDSSPVYSPVSLKSFQLSNHKYYTIKKLAESKVPCVLTSLSASPQVAESIVKDYGFPVVLKLISGFAGKGVMMIKDSSELQSILDTVHLFEEYISVQKFVPAKSVDIRCYVFGDKVLSVKRTGNSNDWRANISRGGKAEIIQGNKKMENSAVKAAKALGFDICAVDFIETNITRQGFAAIEINFQPGPFRKFLGNTVPKKMMSFIKQKLDNKKN